MIIKMINNSMIKIIDMIKIDNDKCIKDKLILMKI